MKNVKKAKTLREIELLLGKASEKALDLIESEARRLMREHSRLAEFCMAMGSTFFLNEQGEVIEHWDYKYLEEFNEMVNDLDAQLHITGTPMRFTAEGEVITDWGKQKK